MTMTTTTTPAPQKHDDDRENQNNTNVQVDYDCIVTRPNIQQDITKQVIRQKLSKRRHLFLTQCLHVKYLHELFQTHILPKFQPQTVQYNGGIANVKEWKISCYLEVMPGGVPTADPAVDLRDALLPLLSVCNDLFLFWYKQQHSYSTFKTTTTTAKQKQLQCHRLMTFITRYTAVHTQQAALLKHIDGAGKVDGSMVVALPTDEPFTGGGLTFWDPSTPSTTNNQNNHETNNEIHYDPEPGDVTFIDRAVWHQADPITSGKRWALVIFYRVVAIQDDEEDEQ